MDFGDRIRGTSISTGAGTITVSAAAFNHLLPSSVLAAGAFVTYFVGNQRRNEWEVGYGTITANVLTRLKFLSSSTGVAITFTDGKKDVLIAIGADLMKGAIRFKRPVRFAIGTDVSSVTNGGSHGGVTAATGDRYLLYGQADLSENGFYVVQAGGTLVRALDLWAGMSASGTAVLVTSGTDAGTQFVCTDAEGADIVGADDLTFTPQAAVAGAGTVVDTQLTSFDGVTGNLIQAVPGSSHDADGRITVTSFLPGAVDLADAGTITLDLSAGSLFRYELGGDRTIAVTNPVLDQAFVVHQWQDATGTRVPAIAGSVLWGGGPSGGDPPTWTTDGEYLDIWGGRCINVSPPIYAGFVYGLGYNYAMP